MALYLNRVNPRQDLICIALQVSGLHDILAGNELRP